MLSAILNAVSLLTGEKIEQKGSFPFPCTAPSMPRSVLVFPQPEAEIMGGEGGGSYSICEILVLPEVKMPSVVKQHESSQSLAWQKCSPVRNTLPLAPQQGPSPAQIHTGCSVRAVLHASTLS